MEQLHRAAMFAVDLDGPPGPLGTVGTDQVPVSLLEFPRDEHGAGRVEGNLLGDCGIPEGERRGRPVRGRAQDDQIVLELIPLFEDARGDIRCDLQLEDQPFALGVGVDRRVVAQGIALHVPMYGLLVPVPPPCWRAA